MPLYTEVPRLVSRRKSRLRNRVLNSAMSAGWAALLSNQLLRSRKSRALVDSTEPEYRLVNTLAQYQCRILRYASSWRLAGSARAEACAAARAGSMETYGRYCDEIAPNSCGCRSKSMVRASAITASSHPFSNAALSETSTSLRNDPSGSRDFLLLAWEKVVEVFWGAIGLA